MSKKRLVFNQPEIEIINKTERKRWAIHVSSEKKNARRLAQRKQTREWVKKDCLLPIENLKNNNKTTMGTDARLLIRELLVMWSLLAVSGDFTYKALCLYILGSVLYLREMITGCCRSGRQQYRLPFAALSNSVGPENDRGYFLIWFLFKN